MIRRMKRQTKKRHSARWPEPVPRIRYRRNMTEVVWWEAPSEFAEWCANAPIVGLYSPDYPTITRLP